MPARQLSGATGRLAPAHWAKVISRGNGSAGIRIKELAIPEFSAGTHAGTDIAGAESLGYQAMGVVVESGASENWIGGGTPGTRNLIGGNSAGIVLEGGATHGNRVAGNDIGIDASCTVSLGNYLGVSIGGARDNVVGGEDLRIETSSAATSPRVS